jgi:three-Cys-motif partner protein
MLDLSSNDSESEQRYKIIKPHTKQKYIPIGGIFYLISRIVKRDFIFIDLYCGEGLCKCEIIDGKIEDKEILGSPLLLLDKFNDERYAQNLDRLYCNDIDALKIKTLKYWIKKKYPNLKNKVKYLNLDAKDVWDTIKPDLSPDQGIIILTDPDNIKTMISFKEFEKISKFINKEFFKKSIYMRRPELIINFMHYGVTRSWDSISSNKLSEIIGIPIDEIENVRRNKKGKAFADEILRLYTENIKKLGYETVLSYDVRNLENNTVIYKLIIASNHPSAPDLYGKKILSWAKRTKDQNIIIEKAHKKGIKTLDEFQ